MQYEIIATVRLVIIAEILGLIAAELRRSVQICNFSRHSSRKRSTTRQLLDIARSLANFQFWNFPKFSNGPGR